MFRDADWVILLGAHPRTPGMTRAELLDINGQIFQEQVSHQRATRSLPKRSEVFTLFKPLGASMHKFCFCS